jgi:hypothetical protein
MLRKLTLWSLAGLLALFVIIQFIPLAGAKTNPPVVAEPAWDSEQTKVLAERACYDCHSNETKWPWYSNIAPVSWLMIYDTNEGRSVLNFSEWGVREQKGSEAAETVQEGTMPPRMYLPTHPQARLNAQEKAQLSAGLQATLGMAEGKGGESEKND